MRQQGDPGHQAAQEAVCPTIPDPSAHRWPDLVQHNFTAAEPDRLWVGELSYVRWWEGVVYFDVALDIQSPHRRWQPAGRLAPISSSTR
jgi:hypothetical protein